MRSNRILSLIIGLIILALFAAMIVSPELFPVCGEKEMFESWLEPSSSHILGTNHLGYDIFTELVYGARQTLAVGVFSSLLSMILAMIIGSLSALKGPIGWICNSLINIFLLLPKLICLVVLSAFIGHSMLNQIILIAAFSWVGAAKNIRAKIIHLNAQPFIEYAPMYGFSKLHILLHHMIPNLSDVVVARFLICVNSCIMMESTMSFLGLGDLYHPTWGSMINIAYKNGAFMRRAYPYLLAPGICIALLSLAFYFIGSFAENRKERI